LAEIEFKELGRSRVKIPVLGLGTWGIGGFSGRILGGEDLDVQALRLGLELGMRFIDSAEMYGHGHSEEVVAKAVKGQRENVFVATKVSPEHITYDGVINACNASLRRLETKYIDLYQVHWPNPRIPISETMKAMEYLVEEGKVRHIGVSNFSVKQTREAQDVLSKNQLAANQVEYSLVNRSVEEDLLPYCAREQITIIAYSPIARGHIPQGERGDQWKVLDQISRKYGKTRAQTALNWLLMKEPVVAIPKAANPQHVKENAGAAGWRLSEEDQEALNEAFK
jgi:diketogulonate reductase-like aldo/keto reductase